MAFCNETSVHASTFAQNGEEQVHKWQLPLHSGFSAESKEALPDNETKKKKTPPLSGLYGLVGHVHELLPAGVITKLHVVNAQQRLDKQTRN